MAIEFKLPELGENIDTIQVLKVMVAKGDAITIDQPVLELETDKATIELPSTMEGVISDVHIEEGDELSVGALVFSIEGGDSDAAADAPAAAEPSTPEPVAEPAPEPEAPADPAPAAAPAAEPTSFDFLIPELGENIDTIQVLKVFAAVGDEISVDQPVLELETDKATIELPSSEAGVVEHVHVRAGDEVSVGVKVFTLKGQPAGRAAADPAPAAEAPSASQAETAAPEVPAAPAAPAAPVPAPVTAPGKRSPAAPSVRKFAREIGIDISQVPGTGPLGRISISDVKNFSKNVNESRPATAVATPAGVPGLPSLPELPDFSKHGTVTRDKMSVIRRKTAEQMTMSWLMVPHVTLFESADITEIDDLRKRYGARAEEAGGKLTIASMVIKIVAQALKVFPNFNASVDMVNREIIYKTYCNIGVAVDTERGLLVPVIKDADKKSMVEIATELTDIATRTRGGKVQMSELEGGSFTVSNIGRNAGTHFTPIINYPEVAILGVGRMTVEKSPEDGSLRKKLPLSLSFDHRAIDGADGSRFLAWIIEALKEPFLLSLGS